jgi:hypothetical protein
MSINACSINEYTIDALCGRRRQAIIDSLLPLVVIVDRGHPQHVAPTARDLSIFRRPREEENVVDVNTLEQPFTQVSIELAGQTYRQTLERDDRTPLVTVSGFSVKDGEEVQVVLTDFNIRIQ